MERSGGGYGGGGGEGYRARDGGESANTRLFVGGIPFKWDDRDLKDYFMKLGNVVNAEVKRSKDPAGGENKSRGFGFVTYEFKDEAARAVQQLNGSKMDGREVAVKWADNHRPRDSGPGRVGGDGRDGDRYADRPRYDSRAAPDRGGGDRGGGGGSRGGAGGGSYGDRGSGGGYGDRGAAGGGGYGDRGGARDYRDYDAYLDAPRDMGRPAPAASADRGGGAYHGGADDRYRAPGGGGGGGGSSRYADGGGYSDRDRFPYDGGGSVSAAGGRTRDGYVQSAYGADDRFERGGREPPRARPEEGVGYAYSQDRRASSSYSAPAGGAGYQQRDRVAPQGYGDSRPSSYPSADVHRDAHRGGGGGGGGGGASWSSAAPFSGSSDTYRAPKGGGGGGGGGGVHDDRDFGMNLDRAAAGGARHGTGGGPMRDRQYGDRNGFSGGGGAHSRGGDARARPY